MLEFDRIKEISRYFLYQNKCLKNFYNYNDLTFEFIDSEYTPTL